jgi:hypothetical protein
MTSQFMQNHGMYNVREFSPLKSYPDSFPTNLRTLSEMCGECFHQRISMVKNDTRSYWLTRAGLAEVLHRGHTSVNRH